MIKTKDQETFYNLEGYNGVKTYPGGYVLVCFTYKFYRNQPKCFETLGRRVLFVMINQEIYFYIMNTS